MFAVCAYAHRWVGDYYHVVNPDAFYFEAWAKGLIGPGLVGSGVAWPLAGLSRVVGYSAASAIIPIALGLLTMAVLYLGVRRLYSPRVALGAAVCWAIAMPSHWHCLAGNVDRDCLHLLIATVGLMSLALYAQDGRTPWMWVFAGTVLLLVIEWGWFGLVAYMPMVVLTVTIHAWDWENRNTYLAYAVLCVGALVAGQVAIPALGFSAVLELQPLNPYTLLEYVTIILPAVVGGWLVWRDHDWGLAIVASSVVTACFASRLGLFAVIGACMLGGVGLVWMWDHRRLWLAPVLCGALVFVGCCWRVPENMTMPREWVDALEWVRDNTPDDARVLAAGDYSNWIMDVAERTPALGVSWQSSLDALYAVYSGDNSSDVMREHRADYLLVSTRDLRIAHAIGPQPWPVYDLVWDCAEYNAGGIAVCPLDSIPDVV